MIIDNRGNRKSARFSSGIVGGRGIGDGKLGSLLKGQLTPNSDADASLKEKTSNKASRIEETRLIIPSRREEFVA